MQSEHFMRMQAEKIWCVFVLLCDWPNMHLGLAGPTENIAPNIFSWSIWCDCHTCATHPRSTWECHVSRPRPADFIWPWGALAISCEVSIKNVWWTIGHRERGHTLFVLPIKVCHKMTTSLRHLSDCVCHNIYSISLFCFWHRHRYCRSRPLF